MHFIYMCDRTCAVVFHEAYFVLFLGKLSVLQYAKEINFFFVSTIWSTDDDKSLQQTEEEGFYMMDEQNFS